MGSKGIFIVEDDPDINASLVELLESEGYQAASASNGVEALDMLREMSEPPCLMLVDYMMPIMDGKKFLENLEIERPGYLSTNATVLLTAASDIKFALPANVELLKKPVNIDQLLEVVKRCCESK